MKWSYLKLMLSTLNIQLRKSILKHYKKYGFTASQTLEFHRILEQKGICQIC